MRGEHPYDEAGIKVVLRAFGENLGSVIHGLHDAAPLDVSRQDLLKDAAYYASAAKHALENKPSEPPRAANPDEI